MLMQRADIYCISSAHTGHFKHLQCILFSQDYVPKTPDVANDIGNVYHTRYTDIHPFLFRVHHRLMETPDAASVGGSVRKLLNYT